MQELEAGTVGHSVSVGTKGGSGAFSCGSFCVLVKMGIKTHYKDLGKLVRVSWSLSLSCQPALSRSARLAQL